MSISQKPLSIITRSEAFEDVHKQMRREAPHTHIILLKYQNNGIPVSFDNVKAMFHSATSHEPLSSSHPAQKGKPSMLRTRSKRPPVDDQDPISKLMWKMYYSMIVPLRLRLASL